MPRKKLTPTEEQRRHVKSLAAVGTEPNDIARYLHVSLKTFLKYYKDEIFTGPFEADAKVCKTMLNMACDGQTPVATIYWTKARCRWNEKQSGDARPVAPPDFIVALDKKAA